MVYTSLVMNFTFPAWSLNLTLPLLTDWNILFDECNRVKQYDLKLPRNQWTDDTIMDLAKPLVARTRNETLSAITLPKVQETIDEFLVKSVCQVANASCVGVNQQYDSNGISRCQIHQDYC